MSELDYDLKRVLEWSAQNETVFTIKDEAGVLAVQANCKNIMAEYAVDEPYDARSMGNAVWASLFAVKHGTEFHQRYGHYPPIGTPSDGVGDKESQSGSGGGGSQSDIRPVVEPSAPNLHPDAIPRRSSMGGGSSVQ